jgi:hypothetical protein
MNFIVLKNTSIKAPISIDYLLLIQHILKHSQGDFNRVILMKGIIAVTFIGYNESG